MNEVDFLRHFSANASQLMWFLGAGTSRTAGMPTATDIIWDLKLKYFCRQENQDIKQHDINNEHVKRKVQYYMDSKGFPPPFSSTEYSFYFDLTFGTNYAAQQQYLFEQLDRNKISLNVGHRALAGLIALNKARIVFTTNFDEVIETSCSFVNNSVIPTYHLEGSYAALQALNTERFPIYAKIHGDFKYQSIKNLQQDLLNNDEEIQKCFIAAANRYGLVVSGYSGRDENVMRMMNQALEQSNPFPSGIIWTAPTPNHIIPAVQEFVQKAIVKGVGAHIFFTDTFDTMLSKIWRQIPDKTDDLDKKVRTARAKKVDIPFTRQGRGYPVVRMNGIPIKQVPTTCAVINTTTILNYSELIELLKENKPKALLTRTTHILGWGAEAELVKALGKDKISSIEPFTFHEPKELICHSSHHHSFFERALVNSICEGLPLILKRDKGYVLMVDAQHARSDLFRPLRQALADRNGNEGWLFGRVPGMDGTTWAEAVKLELEKQNGELYLTLSPTIWIDPAEQRREASEFVKKKRLFRFNTTANKVLDAWLTILLGTTDRNADVTKTYRSDQEYPATFILNSRTAYSHRYHV